MARPLRLEYAGALYHVTSRGDRREDIYLDGIKRGQTRINGKKRGQARINYHHPTAFSAALQDPILFFAIFRRPHFSLGVYSTFSNPVTKPER